LKNSKIITMNTFKTLLISLLIFNNFDFLAQSQQITTVGTSTFTAPAGVMSVKVECVGAGGAGGRVTPSTIFDGDAAGGGGGGAYSMSIVPVMSGQQYSVTVGQGGVNDGTSTDGGDTYFGDGTQVKADGGSTRSGNDNIVGAEGGKVGNSIGIVKYNGGNGGNGNEGEVNGGGGGGAAGSTGVGYSGSEIYGGAARPDLGGSGGQGGIDGDLGATGGNYGGGGGGSSANGSSDRNGGTGGNGVIRISWSQITSFEPSSVCPNSSITIHGSNFTQVDTVWISGLPANFTVLDENTITATVPANATPGYIQVNTTNGKSISLSQLDITNQELSVSVNGLTLSAQYSGGIGATYQWLDCINGNAPINGATNQSYTATQNGLYAVTVTENQCTITSTCTTINTVNSNSEMEITLQVYPIPFTNQLTISSDQRISFVQLVNLEGRVLIESSPKALETHISPEQLCSGVYWLEIKTENGHKTIQLVK
jgi:hypothetical protein